VEPPKYQTGIQLVFRGLMSSFFILEHTKLLELLLRLSFGFFFRLLFLLLHLTGLQS
jgi:hypothetical protein